jgi:hypothetical protein
MARPEVTGKRIGTTPVKPKRSAGPATADPDAIEPSDDADEAPRPVSPAQRARAPPPPKAAPESEVKKKTPRVKLVRVLETPLAFSVEEFCKAHGISIGFFYTLLKEGRAPEIMKLGTRTLISHEAAARWRAERTAASSDTPGDAA